MHESSFTTVKTHLTRISTSFVFSLFFSTLIMNDKSPRNSSQGLPAVSHGKNLPWQMSPVKPDIRSGSGSVVTNALTSDPSVCLWEGATVAFVSQVWGTHKGILESFPAVTGREAGLHDDQEWFRVSNRPGVSSSGTVSLFGPWKSKTVDHPDAGMALVSVLSSAPMHPCSPLEWLLAGASCMLMKMRWQDIHGHAESSHDAFPYLHHRVKKVQRNVPHELFLGFTGDFSA